MDRKRKSWMDKVSFLGDSDIVDVFEDAGGSALEGWVAGRLDEEDEESERIRRKHRRY